MFANNTLDFYKELIKQENIDIYNFFPPLYHESSTCTMINIKQLEVKVIDDTVIKFDIINNTFKDHRTSENLG